MHCFVSTSGGDIAADASPRCMARAVRAVAKAGTSQVSLKALHWSLGLRVRLFNRRGHQSRITYLNYTSISYDGSFPKSWGLNIDPK